MNLLKVVGSTVVTLSVIFTNTAVHAGCAGTIVMGECHGAENDYLGGSSSSGYEGGSGAQYQYDLGSPSGSRDYSYDREAQRRDQQSADPRRELDRGTGQYGGGIYR